MGHIINASDEKQHILQHKTLVSGLDTAQTSVNTGVFRPTQEKEVVQIGGRFDYLGPKNVGIEIKRPKDPSQLNTFSPDEVAAYRRLGLNPDQILELYRIRTAYTAHTPAEYLDTNSKEEVRNIHENINETELHTLDTSTDLRPQEDPIRIPEEKTGEGEQVLMNNNENNSPVDSPSTEKESSGIFLKPRGVVIKKSVLRSTIPITGLRPYKKLPEEKHVEQIILTNTSDEESKLEQKEVNSLQTNEIVPSENVLIDETQEEIPTLEASSSTETSPDTTKEITNVTTPTQKITSPFLQRMTSPLAEEPNTSTENNITSNITTQENTQPITREVEPEKKDVGEKTSQTLEQDISTNRENTPNLESQEKIHAVGKVLDTFSQRYSTSEEWGGPTAKSVRGANKQNEIEMALSSGLSTKQTESWRDSQSLEGLEVFSNDITTLSLELLISKYVPSYVTTTNPSSWSQVSAFDSYEILNNPTTTLYGLDTDQRHEVSLLVSNMDKIIIATHSKSTSNQGVTIALLYDEVKRSIASADKLENK